MDSVCWHQDAYRTQANVDMDSSASETMDCVHAQRREPGIWWAHSASQIDTVLTPTNKGFGVMCTRCWSMICFMCMSLSVEVHVFFDVMC